MKSNESDKPQGNLGQGMLTPGKPGAVKVARPVWRGEWRDVPITSGEHHMAQRRSDHFLGQVTRSAPTLPERYW